MEDIISRSIWIKGKHNPQKQDNVTHDIRHSTW